MFDFQVNLKRYRMENMTSPLQTTNGRALSTKQEGAGMAKMPKERRFMWTDQKEQVEPVLSTRAVSTFSGVLSFIFVLGWGLFLTKPN